jgi:hypothetical protein
VTGGPPLSVQESCIVAFSPMRSERNPGDIIEGRAFPVVFCQEIMRVRKRHQSSIEPLANLGFDLSRAERLGRNGLHRGQRVFDSVV